MADQAKTRDVRIEKAPNGVPFMIPHETQAPLTEGLASWFKIGGLPAALEGSSGENRGDHGEAKVKGNTLLPLSTTVRVLKGEPLMRVGGKPLAVTNSAIKVPCIVRPVRTDGLVSDQSFFTVKSKPAVRGEG